MDSNDEVDVGEEVIELKTKSAPIDTLTASEAQLKHQLSAPSYFFSLKDNELPPFRLPGPEPRPKILLGTFLTGEAAIQMIEAGAAEDNGLNKFIGKHLVETKYMANYALVERTFLTSLISEGIDFAARHDFSSLKLACLLTLYVNAHAYFKWYYWLSPNELWIYFKEVLIRHTIEDSPDGQEVFEPEESYYIMTHFHTNYMSNLPLIHLLTHGAHRLKFSWPFIKRK